jgi:tetratricopeptide (TPR) repeat protein
MASKSAPVVLLLLAFGCSTVPKGPDLGEAKACLKEGRAAAERGDHGAAISWYDAALKAHPEYPQAFFERGYSRLQMRLDEETTGDVRAYEKGAFEDFSLAIRFNPAYSQAYYNRAVMLACRGRYKDAAEDLLNVVRHDPDDGQAHLDLAVIYETKFDDRSLLAMDHYEKAVDLGFGDAKVREKVGLWKRLKMQGGVGAPPAAGSKKPTEEEEKAAAQLHEEFKKLFAAGEKIEALKVVEKLISDYGHTVYVKKNRRQFDALLGALKK